MSHIARYKIKKVGLGVKMKMPSPKKLSYATSAAKRCVTSLALNKATKALSTQRGNIKVVVRVRPISQKEGTANSRVIVIPVDSHMVLFDPPHDDNEFFYQGVKQKVNYQKTRHKNQRFAFDNVYGPNSTNTEIFEEVVNPMLDTLLSGFNCSVFAYGATGSGKTHTMLGGMSNPGLTVQTVMELYKRLDTMANDFETEVVVSYLEVYNETIKDLLKPGTGDLKLREDSNGVAVPYLSTHKPKDSVELLSLLAQGNSIRSQEPTDQNAESSRSHAVFQVYVNLRSRFTDFTNKYKSAKLVMVDLAGSEKGAATGCSGVRFREGASINKSLLALGNCINALAEGKGHIPYRDSKLTRILKDSLGGNCKTLMIANVSPSSLSSDDSYNTLRYADRAKKIKFQLKNNTMSVSACLTQYTKVVEEMGHKIQLLEKELAESRKRCKCEFTKSDAVTQTEPEEVEVTPMDLDITTTVDNPTFGGKFGDATFQVDDVGGIGDCCNATFVHELVNNNHVVVTSPGGVLDNTVVKYPSVIPPAMRKELDEYLEDKQQLIRNLCEASAIAASTATRIGVKERRIKSINKLKTTKNTNKIQKQLDPLHNSYKEALEKKNTAHTKLEVIDEKINRIKELMCIDRDNQVPVKITEFVDICQLKGNFMKEELLKTSFQSISTYYLEEWQKGENLLGKCVEFLSSQYLLNKHYNNTTKQMDTEYEALVASLCGTRVQFSGDLDVDNDSTIPYLKRFLTERFILSKLESKDLPPTPQHNANSYFSKNRTPTTPPRDKSSAAAVMSTTSDEEESSSEESQINLASITYIHSPPPPQPQPLKANDIHSVVYPSSDNKENIGNYELEEDDEPEMISPIKYVPPFKRY